MATEKYKAAGQFLQDLRKQAGYPSRDQFVKLCGDEASYDRISKLEVGRVEPKAKDLQIYLRVTGCDAIALLAIPV